MVLRKHELEAKLKDDHQLITSGVLRNEHPFDASNEFRQFMHACRLGNLKRCQELISAGVQINGKDEFDYTPLIIVSISFWIAFVKATGSDFSLGQSMWSLRACPIAFGRGFVFILARQTGALSKYKLTQML